MKSINYGDDDSDMKYVHDLGKLWLFYSAHLWGRPQSSITTKY